MMRDFHFENKPENKTETTWSIVFPTDDPAFFGGNMDGATLTVDERFCIGQNLYAFDPSWDLNKRNPSMPYGGIRYGREVSRGDYIAQCSVTTIYGDTYRDQINRISGSDDYDKVRYWESVSSWQIVELYRVGNLGKLRKV